MDETEGSALTLPIVQSDLRLGRSLRQVDGKCKFITESVFWGLKKWKKDNNHWSKPETSFLRTATPNLLIALQICSSLLKIYTLTLKLQAHHRLHIATRESSDIGFINCSSTA
ncbi:hypothetical protein K1719_045167 [Acacia pycnantha]|nr:hypothetical protein K1719_045167 [Acacia pycnantha]